MLKSDHKLDSTFKPDPPFPFPYSSEAEKVGWTEAEGRLPELPVTLSCAKDPQGFFQQAPRTMLRMMMDKTDADLEIQQGTNVVQLCHMVWRHLYQS